MNYNVKVLLALPSHDLQAGCQVWPPDMLVHAVWSRTAVTSQTDHLCNIALLACKPSSCRPAKEALLAIAACTA